MDKEEKKKFHKKYLKSKEFKAVKEYVLSRDKHKCVVCGREDKLVCHHRCYKHLGEANLAEIEDCITLCQADHLAIHSKNHNKQWFSIEHPRNRNDLKEIEIDKEIILVGINGEEFYDSTTFQKYKIYSNKKRKGRRTIHIKDTIYYCNRLVAKAFPEICGDWFENCEVHHINGNPIDDRAENLRVISPIEHKEIHKDFLGEWAKNNLTVKIFQYDLNGNYITTYSNSIEASEKLGICSSSIRNCTAGISNSAGGYIWTTEYHDKVTPIKEKDMPKKSIIQYDLENNLIKKWDSIKEASSYFGKPNSSSIGNCLTGRSKTAFGYKWKYN